MFLHDWFGPLSIESWHLTQTWQAPQARDAVPVDEPAGRDAAAGTRLRRALQPVPAEGGGRDGAVPREPPAPPPRGGAAHGAQQPGGPGT